jgi:tetratricopeptide repeat protein 30
LIEAYNLKAAIDYMLNNTEEAKEALNEMPPRSDEELDSVTLHNLALVNIEKDPDDSFKKLNFLLKVIFYYINNYLEHYLSSRSLG